MYQRVLHLVAGDLLVDSDADEGAPRQAEQEHQQERHDVAGIGQVLGECGRVSKTKQKVRQHSNSSLSSAWVSPSAYSLS